MRALGNRLLERLGIIAAIAIFIMELLVSVVCLRDATRWIDRPFAGFLTYERYPMLFALSMPGWTGNKAGLRFFDVILEAQGQRITRGKEIQELAGQVPVGTRINYKARKRGDGIAECEIPTMRFTFRDYCFLFLILYLTSLIFLFFLGAGVFYLRPNTQATWIFLIWTFVGGLFIMILFDLVTTGRFHYLLISCWAVWPATFIHLGLYFPDRKSFVRDRWWLVAIPYCISAGLLTARFYSEYRIPDLRAVSIQLTTIYFVVALFTVFYLMTLSYLHPRTVFAKRQARLVLWGGTFSVAVGASYAVLAVIFIENVPINFAFPVVAIFAGSVTLAIIKYHLFDINLLLRHSLVYSTLVVLITGLYGLLIAITALFFQGREFARSPIFLLVFAIVVVLIFDPLRNALRGFVDKALYGKRIAYRKALEQFVEASTSVLQLDEIKQHLVANMKNLLRVRTFSLLLPVEGGKAFEVDAAIGEDSAACLGKQFPRSHPGFQAFSEGARELFIFDLKSAVPGREQDRGAKGLFEELRAVLLIPVLYKGELRGVLGLGEKATGDLYTLEEVTLLKTLAGQVGIGMENALSYEALGRANRIARARALELSTLYDAGKAITSTLNIKRLFKVLLRLVIENLAFDRAMIMQVDRARGVLGGFSAMGGRIHIREAKVSELYLPPRQAEGPIAELIHEHKAILVEDIERFLATVGDDVSYLIRYLKTKAFLAVPLVAKGELKGVIAVDRAVTGRRLTERDLHTMETLASQIAVAIDNAQAYQTIAELNTRLEKAVRDRTQELVLANQRLRDTARHKSEFLANMSHELRSPLNAILGFTALVLDGIYGEVSSPLHEAFCAIKESGEHLLNLINDVLDLSRIEAGKLTLSLGQYSVETCVEAALASLEKQILEKGLRVVKHIDGSVPIVYGDEKRITQIIRNLVSNAIKFTEEGAIEIDLSQDLMGHLVFRIADSGIGIPREDHERIFAEFSQVDGSITREHGGTGLGLSLSKKLVEMHGGRIWVESEVGKGSVFYIELPMQTSTQA